MRVWLLVVGCAACVAGAVAVGFVGESAEAGPAADPGTSPFTVFLTGDTRGYIAPCGCDGALRGGLPRRATYLRGKRKPGDLTIDLGNLVTGTRPHEKVKLSFVLRGLELLDYDLLVPGEGELQFGEEFERGVGRLKRPAVICANLVYADSKKLVFPAYRVFEVAGGRRVTVIGLTSAYQRLPSRYSVIPPSEALWKVLSEVSKKDLRIVVGHLSGKVALDLAKMPGVSLVAASRVPRGTQDLLRRGGAPVMFVGERGQYVSWVRIGKAPEAGGQFWLTPSVKDDKRLAFHVAEHDRVVSKLGAHFAAEAVAGFKRNRWIGSQSCGECHRSEHEAWKRSPHAHAIGTLESKGQNKNPNCLQCHLSDVAPKVERVQGVGCEACHGGGALHAELQRRKDQLIRPRTFQSAESSCVRCHDRPNSPKFILEEYWSRIRHGVPKDR